MNHELFHNTKVVQCAAADASGLAFSTTQTGQAVDTQGFHSLTFLIDVGDNDGNVFSGTDKITFTVEEGNVLSGVDITDHAEIAAGDYLGAKDSAGASWDRILDETLGDNQTYQIGVRLNTTRYKRVVATEGGTVTTVPLTIIALLGNPRHAPV